MGGIAAFELFACQPPGFTAIPSGKKRVDKKSEIPDRWLNFQIFNDIL